MLVKLWNCRFAGKYLATVRNVKTIAFNNDSPDTDAIREALPRRYHDMRLMLWLTSNIPGEPIAANVWIIRQDGSHAKHSITCDAEIFDTETGLRHDPRQPEA